jgi:hypothetical protein
MAIVFKVAQEKIEELQQSFARIEVLDIDLQLPPAQTRQHVFKHCDIELRFAAEIVVEHAGIAACLADDAADAGTGKAVRDELPGGGAQEQFAALRGFAARAARLFRLPARTRQILGFAIGHLDAVHAAEGASLLVRSSSDRSPPRAPTIETPMGQPCQKPSGSAACGAPLCPAIEVSVSAL